MRHRPASFRRTLRRASSAVELALLLPILVLLLLFTVDFARLYYHYSIVTNCARNGALYASNPAAQSESPYYNVDPIVALNAAALADATDLTPQPTVSATYATDNSYVDVTVVYPFATISNYPWLSNPINITRTVRMRMVPATPN